MRRLFPVAAALALAAWPVSASQGYAEADEQLTWAYQALLAAYSPAGREALRREERGWIALRNRTCGFEARNVCAERWINRRAAELEGRMARIASDPLRVRVGQCFATTVKRVTTRLEDGEGRELAGSGSAVEYADGHHMVDYATDRNVSRWRAGDPVRLCVTALPANCPRGDYRGVRYHAANRRTGTGWTAADSQHMCGGA